MADIVMPRLSEAMKEGKVLRWCVAEGAVVSAGDVIAEVETDKANMEIEVVEDGVIDELCASPGDMVPVGTSIARFTPRTGQSTAVPESTAGTPPTGPGEPLASFTAMIRTKYLVGSFISLQERIAPEAPREAILGAVAVRAAWMAWKRFPLLYRSTRHATTTFQVIRAGHGAWESCTIASEDVPPLKVLAKALSQPWKQGLSEEVDIQVWDLTESGFEEAEIPIGGPCAQLILYGTEWRSGSAPRSLTAKVVWNCEPGSSFSAARFIEEFRELLENPILMCAD